MKKKVNLDNLNTRQLGQLKRNQRNIISQLRPVLDSINGTINSLSIKREEIHAKIRVHEDIMWDLDIKKHRQKALNCPVYEKPGRGFDYGNCRYFGNNTVYSDFSRCSNCKLRHPEVLLLNDKIKKNIKGK